MEEMRNPETCNILERTSKGSNCKSRLRWDDNIKVDMNSIKCVGVDWTHVHI